MKKTPTVPHVVVLLAGIAAGCGESRLNGQSETVMRDSAGVTIVENQGPGWDSTSAWTRSRDPVVRLGEASGEDPATRFSLVRSVARLGDGRILVLDSQAAEVRWFDEEGNHLLSAGGQGRGPGEFNSPARLIVAPGDTVVVEDRPGWEHVLFAPEGEFIREDRLDLGTLLSGGRFAECDSRTLPDRSLLMCQHLPGEDSSPVDPGPGRLRRFLQFVRIFPDLSEQHPLGLYGGIEQWGVSYGGRTEFVFHPFHARTFVAAGGEPMRVAIATNPHYSIEMWTPDGSLDRIVRRGDGRRVATADEAGEAEERFFRLVGEDPALRNRILAEVEIPDSLPAVTDLEIARDGGLWVGRTVHLPSATTTAYDVFRADGTYLGEMRFPARFDLHEVGEDYVLGVRLDELDVPYVELYALERR